MLKELFESLKSFATDQAKVIPVVLDGVSPSKRSKLVWNPAQQDIERIDRDRPDNQHVFGGVDSLVDYINNQQDKSHRTNVWVGENRITVEVVENGPGDILTMPLKFHPLFAKLKSWGKKASIPQAEAVKLLRQHLAPFDPNSAALTACRNLKIATTDNFESEQSHAAARMGKSVMQAAAGAGELPEYLDVRTTVYLKAGSVTVRTIRVWLSIDFATRGNILFEPDEAQMDEACLLERLEIIGAIQAELDKERDVCVYDGEYSVS